MASCQVALETNEIISAVRYGELWLELIAQVVELEPSETIIPKPLTRSESKKYKKLMALMSAQAESIGLARESIVSKKIGQDLLRTLLNGDEPDLEGIPEWRIPHYEQVINAFVVFLESE